MFDELILISIKFPYYVGKELCDAETTMGFRRNKLWFTIPNLTLPDSILGNTWLLLSGTYKQDVVAFLGNSDSRSITFNYAKCEINSEIYTLKIQKINAVV